MKLHFSCRLTNLKYFYFLSGHAYVNNFLETIKRGIYGVFVLNFWSISQLYKNEFVDAKNMLVGLHVWP